MREACKSQGVRQRVRCEMQSRRKLSLKHDSVKTPTVYILPLVCSLHFTLRLHFIPAQQSAVRCLLRFTLTASVGE